jgi:hypothetical protein
MAESQEVLYDCDFARWCSESARLLREGRFAEADMRHIAEEIEDMGKRDRREAVSHMHNLLKHLLKWRLQADRRSASWQQSIVNARRELQRIFADSRSIEYYVLEHLETIYSEAAEDAILEMGSHSGVIEGCPWRMSDLLDSQFWPA